MVKYKLQTYEDTEKLVEVTKKTKKREGDGWNEGMSVDD